MRLRVAESNSADASTVDRLRRTVALVRARPCARRSPAVKPPAATPQRQLSSLWSMSHAVAPLLSRAVATATATARGPQAQNELVRTTAAMERLEHELILERESNKQRPTPEQLAEAAAQIASLEAELGASRRFGLTPRPDWPRLRPDGPFPGETSASTRAIAEAMAAALERAKNEAVTVRMRGPASSRCGELGPRNNDATPREVRAAFSDGKAFLSCCRRLCISPHRRGRRRRTWKSATSSCRRKCASCRQSWRFRRHLRTARRRRTGRRRQKAVARTRRRQSWRRQAGRRRTRQRQRRRGDDSGATAERRRLGAVLAVGAACCAPGGQLSRSSQRVCGGRGCCSRSQAAAKTPTTTPGQNGGGQPEGATRMMRRQPAAQQPEFILDSFAILPSAFQVARRCCCCCATPKSLVLFTKCLQRPTSTSVPPRAYAEVGAADTPVDPKPPAPVAQSVNPNRESLPQLFVRPHITAPRQAAAKTASQPQLVTRTALGVLEAVHLHHVGRHDALEDELSDAIPLLHCVQGRDRRTREGVSEQDSARAQTGRRAGGASKCKAEGADGPWKSTSEKLKRITPTSPR